jgi:hypothetical protein
MGKGSGRRPEDTQAIAKNWPFGGGWVYRYYVHPEEHWCIESFANDGSMRAIEIRQHESEPSLTRCRSCKNPLVEVKHRGRA